MAQTFSRSVLGETRSGPRMASIQGRQQQHIVQPKAPDAAHCSGQKGIGNLAFDDAFGALFSASGGAVRTCRCGCRRRLHHHVISGPAVVCGSAINHSTAAWVLSGNSDKASCRFFMVS